MKRFEKISFNKTHIGETCKTVRLEHNLTLDEFANFTGYTRQTIVNFESGKHLSLDLFLKYYALDTGGVNNDN